MTEAYLHYIWQHQLYNQTKLCTQSGEPISILQRGYHNTNAGPDFLEARIKIGDKQWAGHVEIHVASSDWNLHKHQSDEAYNNVILHVVYEDDARIRTKSGSTLPTLVLAGKFDEMGYWRYERFVGAKKFIACENDLNMVDALHRSNMVQRALVERLEDKSGFVIDVLQKTNGDWAETFYRILFYAFGLKVNAEPMLRLAERLPYKLIEKHKHNQKQIAALVYGVSGLLHGDEAYVLELKKEFDFLQKKYNLKPLKPSEWKFARMRPIGFPTIRLAQLVQILTNQSNLFRFFVDAASLHDLRHFLKYDLHKFWTNHYRFGKTSVNKAKVLSDRFMDVIMINAIIPTLYNYGMRLSKPELQDRAIRWLEELKPEQNNIVNRMGEIGFAVKNAADSQGVLQLYNAHCRHRKCLSCAIGVKLLKQ